LKISNYAHILTIASLKGGGALLNLGITFLVMNRASPADAGKFLFILSAVYIYSYIARLGSDNFIVKSFSSLSGAATNKENATYSSLLLACLIIPLTSLPILTITTDLSLKEAISTLAIISFYSVTQVNSRFSQAKSKIVQASLSMSAYVPAFFISLFLIVSNSSTEASIGLLLTIYLASSFASAALSTKYKKICKFKILELKQEYKECFSFFSTGLIGILILWGGSFYAGYALPFQDVGQLSASQRITVSINLILVAISLYASPIISREFKSSGTKALIATIAQCNRAILFFCVITAATLFTFLDEISDFFEITAENQSLIIILAIAQIFSCLTGLSLQILNMTGNQAYTRRSTAFGGGVLLLSCAVSTISPSTTAFATSIALGLIGQNIAALFFVKRKLGLNPIKI
tara:strand:+ start:7413 stop:8636 length:1224 start_codon:yes stop_codon:yes gene_type:complete